MRLSKAATVSLTVSVSNVYCLFVLSLFCSHIFIQQKITAWLKWRHVRRQLLVVTQKAVILRIKQTNKNIRVENLRARQFMLVAKVTVRVYCALRSTHAHTCDGMTGDVTVGGSRHSFSLLLNSASHSTKPCSYNVVFGHSATSEI
jgi:hypothetical protein